VSNRSGKRNLWLMAVRGGEAWRLTDAKTGVGSYKWSPDGKHLAFTAVDPPTPQEQKAAKEKDDARVVGEQAKMERLYVIAVAGGDSSKPHARKLTTGRYSLTNFGQAAAPFDWSPDGKAIVFEHAPTARLEDWRRADLAVVDVAHGTVKPLAATGAAEMSPHCSPDGRWIAFIKSDQPATWGYSRTIQVLPAAGGEPRELAQTADRRPTLVGWSADSKRIYFTEAHGTINRLCALPLRDKPEIISHQQGVMGNAFVARVRLNATRTLVGFGYQTPHEPSEAFVSRLDQFAPVQVSTVNAGLPYVPLAAPRRGAGRPRTEWKSRDC